MGNVPPKRGLSPDNGGNSENFRIQSPFLVKNHVAQDSPIQKRVSPFHRNILWAPKEHVEITFTKEIRILN